ncbi:MAG: hypothetical protein NTV49_02900 [Kiritimatiellaeota bacterium]|nr:hypothetical protein [Kiritimatiellota bacterium]
MTTEMVHRTTGSQRWLRCLGALALVLLALAVRLPRLAERPLHTDESVNAYLVGQVLDGGHYVYDPQDRHGPALCASTLPVARAAGETSFVALREATLRLAPVIMGVLAVLIFLGLAADLGALAAGLAALLWALSALPVYYSRYFIHETGFVALTLGLLLCSRRAALGSSLRWAALAGLCAGLLLAFKETAVLHYAALAATAVVVMFFRPDTGAAPGPRLIASARRLFQAWPLLAAGVAIATLAVLTAYSWAFTDWRGPVELLRSFGLCAARSGGAGHAKHAGYYLILLGGGWSGIPFLALAALGGIWSWRQRHPAGRFFLVYLAMIAAIYSAIPYKTPWLALNLWLPLGPRCRPALAPRGAGARDRAVPGGPGRRPAGAGLPGSGRRAQSLCLSAYVGGSAAAAGAGGAVDHGPARWSEPDHRRRAGRSLAVALVSPAVPPCGLLAAGTGSRRGGSIHHRPESRSLGPETHSADGVGVFRAAAGCAARPVDAGPAAGDGRETGNKEMILHVFNRPRRRPRFRRIEDEDRLEALARSGLRTRMRGAFFISAFHPNPEP